MDQQLPAVTTTLPASRGIKLVRRVAGPLWRRIGMAAVLKVPGRRTGTPLEVTLVPVNVDGTWYLLSMYGDTDWVRNLRAAGRGELRRKGRTEAFTAIEVHTDERDRVIARFRAWSPRPFNGDFERRPAAADHPAFRIEPIS
ncbi:MAG: nitroreductase family deazaflavin-dependent oxidoreductase [Chloroflexota bacterium]